MANDNSIQLGRAVPNYLGDWIYNKSYCKLDTVTYNSASYIAIRDVPAGIVAGGVLVWTKVAKDSNVVHNAGNETITGDKSLTGNTNLSNTTILAGNYGLRVTSTGFQKTTNGGSTWVNATL